MLACFSVLKWSLYFADGRRVCVLVEYEVARNKTQLSAATDCALEVFDSHVQVDDVRIFR